MSADILSFAYSIGVIIKTLKMKIRMTLAVMSLFVLAACIVRHDNYVQHLR
jgi:hypothetical protein